MFGSKKPKAAKQLWSIQLLTSGYLVEGTLAAEDYEVSGDDIFAVAAVSTTGWGGLNAFQNLRLTNALVRPTGNLATPEQTFAAWGLANMNEIVGVAPRDAASSEAAQKAFRDYKHPREVMVYVGPYRIRAKLMADSADQGKSPFEMTNVIPLTEASVDCQLPGARMTSFQMPWLLLNSRAGLHGYGLV